MNNPIKTKRYSTAKPARGWPPERRAAQAERIKALKPWLHSTGPKTQAGKARCRLNAYKHGRRGSDIRTLLLFLRWQRECVYTMKSNLPRPPYPARLSALCPILSGHIEHIRMKE